MKQIEHLCNIFKTVFLFVEHELIELLLNDEYYMMVFGILEYDPDMKGSKNIVKHRDFLRHKAKFLKVLDIKDQKKIELIHFNYRL